MTAKATNSNAHFRLRLRPLAHASLGYAMRPRFGASGFFLASAMFLSPSVFSAEAQADSEPVSMRMFSAPSSSTEGASASLLSPVTASASSSALQGADKSAPRSPTDQAALLNEQGVERVLQGDRAQGIAMITKALSKDPRNTTVLYNLAGLYLAEGEPNEAISLMERALDLEPSDLSFLNRYAEAMVGANNVGRAIGTYEKIVLIDPSFNEVQLKLGTLYAMQKNWPKAEEWLLRAKEVMGNDTRVLSNLGSVLVVQEKYTEAIDVLEKSQMKIKTAETAVVLGIASESLGRLEDAIRYYRQAQGLGESAEDLAQHIVKLEELKLEASTASAHAMNTPSPHPTH